MLCYLICCYFYSTLRDCLWTFLREIYSLSIFILSRITISKTNLFYLNIWTNLNVQGLQRYFCWWKIWKHDTKVSTPFIHFVFFPPRNTINRTNLTKLFFFFSFSSFNFFVIFSSRFSLISLIHVKQCCDRVR